MHKFELFYYLHRSQQLKLCTVQTVPCDYGSFDYTYNSIIQASSPIPLLNLKIRNTTKYLNWRLSILKRDNFTCRICHGSVKKNKSLRLQVHHPKSSDDICNENNVSTVQQECKELWNVNNGISICYRCHKDVEKLRTKLRDMFLHKYTREHPQLIVILNARRLFGIYIISFTFSTRSSIVIGFLRKWT